MALTNYASATINLNNVDRNISGDNSFKILVWGIGEYATNGAISSDDISQIGNAPRIKYVVDRLLNKKGMDVSIVCDTVTEGTQATGKIEVQGTALASYEITIHYNGEKTKVGITKGEKAETIAANIGTALNKSTLLTAVVRGAVVGDAILDTDNAILGAVNEVSLTSVEANQYANKKITITGHSSDVLFATPDMEGGTGSADASNLAEALNTNTWYKMVVVSEQFDHTFAQSIKPIGESSYDKNVHQPFVAFHATNVDVQSIGMDPDDRVNSCFVVLGSNNAAHEIVAEVALKQAELELDENAMSLTAQILPSIHCPSISITKVTNLQANGFSVCELDNNACKVNIARTRGNQTGYEALASIYKNIKVIGYANGSLVRGGFMGRPVVESAANSINPKAIDTKIVFDVVRNIFRTVGAQAIIDDADTAIANSECVRDSNDANKMIVNMNYKISGNLYNLENNLNFRENG